MIKKSIYPKTTRLGRHKTTVTITEKLDGSNLVFFKHPVSEELWIAQRNRMYRLSQIDGPEVFQGILKGLYGWLKEHGETLRDELHAGSAVVGEWIGMGRIKYDLDQMNRFHIFAKANVSKDLELYNIKYDNELFIYPFKDQIIPNYMSVVPLIEDLHAFPSVEYMDELYREYSHSLGRSVEGFCVSDGQLVRKYVRMKNGNLQDHKA